MGVGYRQQLSSKWSFKSSVFLILKMPTSQDLSIYWMIKQIVLVSLTLNYKDTLWSVPFETSLGTEMALTIIPFLFSKFICFNPIKGVLLELNSVISNRKATKLFFTSRFSLSEKLHLETGLAFNTTRYSCEIFCSRKQFRLPYLWEVWSEQDSPIDLLKTRRFMRPLVKGFRHQQFRKH
jgi:iron complex outermembrane receptor protein